MPEWALPPPPVADAAEAESKFAFSNATRNNNNNNSCKDTKNSCKDTKNNSNSCYNRCIATSVWPGLGLLGESFVIFSLGTLPPLWEALFFNKDIDEEDTYIQSNNEEPATDQQYQQDRLQLTSLVGTLTVAVVAGIILGMLALGVAADSIGRRRGSILTALLMLVGTGSLFLLSVTRVSRDRDESVEYVQNLFAAMAGAFFLLGLGVGGEYPLSAASAAERAESRPPPASSVAAMSDDNNCNTNNTTTTNNNNNRGQQVQLVFSMQGVGTFLHCVLLTLLLAAFQHNSSTIRLRLVLLWTWQILYGIGTLILGILVYTRIRYLQESTVWQNEAATAAGSTPNQSPHHPQSSNRHDDDKDSGHSSGGDYVAYTEMTRASSGPVVLAQNESDCDHHVVDDGTYSTSTVLLLLRHYGVRLFAVSSSWFLWDVAFYGNKLFQSAFLLSITTAAANTSSSSSNDDDGNYDNETDNTTDRLIQFAAAATANAGVASLGYIAAAFVVDLPFVGRRRLQQWGFFITGSLFVCVGYSLDALPTQWLIGLYFLSSFFGQLGPNATTFVVPAEIFPTSYRAVCHGIAAASGKLGALTATLLFGSVISRDPDRFLYSGYASWLAAAITFWLIPETVGLELAENDRHWHCILRSHRMCKEYSSGATTTTTNMAADCSSISRSSFREDWDLAFLSRFERRKQQQQQQETLKCSSSLPLQRAMD